MWNPVAGLRCVAAGTTALGDFVEPHATGKMRVIAVLGPRRLAALPDVATFAEQGYRIDWEYWLGLFAPAQTPAPEVQRINAALGRALALATGRDGSLLRMRKVQPAIGVSGTEMFESQFASIVRTAGVRETLAFV